MLAIEIEFLTGRYVATAYNTRLEAEWPPHPARLFSALVATLFDSETPALEERQTLEWLEGQGAPSIHASDASAREVTTVFVPVNDAGLTNVDAEATALDEARSALADAEATGDSKATKAARSLVKKMEKRLDAAIARSVSLPKASTNPANAARVLPEGRVRQPRTFPSVTPADPRVTYLWPTAELTTSRRDAIDRLLARLVRLGHSSSFVAARVVDAEVDPVWRPTKDGELILRTVQPGQLAALDDAFVLHRETEPRVMPARFESYTQLTPAQDAEIPESVFSAEWLVLRRVGGPSLPMVACAGVARTLRSALMSHADQPVAEILSGHSSSGAPSERDHLAFVPLPFIGHKHASGGILGVALVLPRAASHDERATVFRAVEAWEQSSRLEDEDTPVLPLTLGAAGILELERVEWGSVQAAIRPHTWCQPANSWSSATPIALDRNPGDLRSRDPNKIAAAVREAASSVARGCERIGLPTPAHVEILPAAPWAGGAKAKRFPPYPEAPGKTRRVLTHARIEFSEKVRGPILLGAGRYLGLGLLRPEVDRG